MAEKDAEAERLRVELEQQLAAKAQEALEAQDVAERQRSEQAYRRMMNRGLLRGFEAWREMVGERSRLRGALGGMRVPGLRAALGKWRTFMKEEAAAKEQQERDALQMSFEERLKSERDAQEAELETVQSNAERERAQLQQQLDEQAKALTEGQLAHQREKRELALRRLMNRNLREGFDTWRSVAAEMERARYLERRMPQLIILPRAFRRWRKEIDAAQRRAAVRARRRARIVPTRGERGACPPRALCFPVACCSTKHIHRLC